MTNGSGILDGSTKWLLEQWLDKLSNVLESMTEEHPVMTWMTDGDDELGDGALVVEQRFTGSPEPMLWIGLPESVHQELGKRVLSAAGVDASDAEENRATTLEIVEQSIGGLSSALAGRLSREINRETSRQPQFFPSGLPVIRVVLAFGENPLPAIWIAFHPMLISWMDAKPSDTAQEEPLLKTTADAPEPPVSTRSFDLLLDVALPVSVSFGKTELAVKDVLKLTTGSIVELNRSISEPVDIIVNNCIIARGEVVVVEGNYGVRIQNLVSRKERLRTGGAAASENRNRSAASRVGAN